VHQDRPGRFARAAANCDQPHTLPRSAAAAFASESAPEADNNEWVSGSHGAKSRAGLLKDDQSEVKMISRPRIAVTLATMASKNSNSLVHIHAEPAH
jgi:hypothetical protein